MPLKVSRGIPRSKSRPRSPYTPLGKTIPNIQWQGSNVVSLCKYPMDKHNTDAFYTISHKYYNIKKLNTLTMAQWECNELLSCVDWIRTFNWIPKLDSHDKNPPWFHLQYALPDGTPYKSISQFPKGDPVCQMGPHAVAS